MNTDACTCEDPRGNIIFNLHFLDNLSNPMQGQPSVPPPKTIYNNPCSAMTNPDCGDGSVCFGEAG